MPVEWGNDIFRCGKMNTDKIKAALRKKKPKDLVIASDRMLSTGSSMLNLACSGQTCGGFPMGSYIFFVGDSISGKTFVALTCFAEAAINKRFDDYRFIYDATEHGALMDFRKFFGQAVAERVEPPEVDGEGSPIYSVTAEDFYFHLDDAFKEGKPFIYVLDSQDALSSEVEGDKFIERKTARRKGKEVSGTYGDNKAKVHSSNIRRVIGELARTGSILIVINQTRDSFGLFEKKTYSGGHALKFYATLQLWASVRKKLTRMYRGKKRELGILSKVQVKKNRITGRDRTVTIPIYHSSGIDDTGSMVSYLIEEEVWKKSGNVIMATGLGPAIKMKYEDLIQKIEADDMVDDLCDLVGKTWMDIERACEVKRKRRYE